MLYCAAKIWTGIRRAGNEYLDYLVRDGGDARTAVGPRRGEQLHLGAAPRTFCTRGVTE